MVLRDIKKRNSNIHPLERYIESDQRKREACLKVFENACRLEGKLL